MRVVSIDIETTGLNPEVHKVTELGAVIWDTEDKSEIELGGYINLPTFSMRVFHKEKLEWSGFARSLQPEYRKVENLYLEYATAFCIPASNLEERESDVAAWCGFWNACPPSRILKYFKSFLEQNNIDKVIPVGKNFQGFDMRFLRRLPHFTDIDWSHRGIDPAMYFIRPEDKEPPSLSTCLKRAGADKKVTHSAAEDALDTLFCLKYGLDKLNG